MSLPASILTQCAIFQHRIHTRLSDTAHVVRAICVDKESEFPNQKLFAVCGTPDKVRGYLVGDVFGVLCLHTRQYHMCANSCEVRVRAALPLLEWEGYPAAPS